MISTWSGNWIDGQALVRKLQDGRTQAWKSELAALSKSAPQGQSAGTSLQSVVGDWQAWINRAAKPANQPSELFSQDGGQLSPAQPGAKLAYPFQTTLHFHVDGDGAFLIAAAPTLSAGKLGLSVLPEIDVAGGTPPKTETPAAPLQSVPSVETIFSGVGRHQFRVDLGGDSAAAFTIRGLAVNLTAEQTRNWLLSWYTDKYHSQQATQVHQSKNATAKPLVANSTNSSPGFVGEVVNLLGDSPAAGNYVAIANTEDGRKIQLAILRPADIDPRLGNNGPPTAWPSCGFPANQGDNIVATVTGSEQNVAFELYVYFLGPIATSH